MEDDDWVIKPFTFIKKDIELPEIPRPKPIPIPIWPKIPTRFVFKGDKVKARNLIGLGRKRFSDLTTALGFQELETGFNTLKMSDGTTIKASQSYGISKVSIYVPTVKEVSVLRGEEGEAEAVFFYHIVHSGIVDNQLGGTVYVPELVTNRIIIWGIGLYSDLEEKGTGELLLDVDIANETVHYPEGLTVEQEDAYKTLADDYYLVMNPTIDPSAREPKDMLADWFITGPMANPFTAYTSCGNTENRASVFLNVNESWSGANGNNWWTMIEYPEFPVSDAWKDEWCPSFGGDQDQLYTENVWPLIDDNAESYPEYRYAANYYPPDNYTLVVKDIMDCPYTPYKTGLFMLGWQWDLLDSFPEGGKIGHLGFAIKSGNFFTGNTEYPFPCFFSIENEDYNFGVFYFSFNSYDSSENITGDCAEYVTFNFALATGSAKRETISITTPLETLTVSEYSVSSTPTCSELNCFDMSNDLNISINGGGGYLSNELREYLPCDVGTAKTISKVSEVYDDDFFTQTSIVDESETDLNLFGLLIQEEQNAKVKASYREETDSHYYCNGNDYGTSQSGVPYTYHWHAGVIIYIISPELWWEETDGIKSNFWDIHSEESEPRVINPNRCLVLEEYINGVLDEKKELTETLSALPHKDGTGTYTLETYGHEFYSGFTHRL